MVFSWCFGKNKKDEDQVEPFGGEENGAGSTDPVEAWTSGPSAPANEQHEAVRATTILLTPCLRFCSLTGATQSEWGDGVLFTAAAPGLTDALPQGNMTGDVELESIADEYMVHPASLHLYLTPHLLLSCANGYRLRV